MLKGDVHVDIEFQVFFLNGRDAKPKLKAAVPDFAQVGQEFIEGKGRHGHVIKVEHVARGAVIEFGFHDEPIHPKAHVHAHVEGAARLPFQIGIGVAVEAQHRFGQTLIADDACWAHQIERIIGLDARLIAACAIAHAHFPKAEGGEERGEERFFVDIPRG